MRGGALPAALVFAALGFALSFAPRRVRGPALIAAIASALASLQFPADPSLTEGIYAACWLNIIIAAASVNLPGTRAEWAMIALALICGTAAGAVAAIAASPRDFALAATAALVIVPASWLVARGWGIAVKVAASWLIAIAVLAAALPLTPTPGYAPDHME
jgi:hypothetical protein